MKLRIRGNSIRLRLTQSDVEKLNSTGKIKDCVEFGALNKFCYELSTSVDDSETLAKFEDHCLSISIPAGEAESWISSETVGIERLLPVDGNKILRVLVEKDFACLTERVGEDESDAFPNPFVKSKH